MYVDVDGTDRLCAVLRRRDELEPAVGDERREDDLGPLGDLVRVHLDAHHRLGPDVVPQVQRRIDEAHGPRC